ncbi:LuxR family transcriptional regulator [Actinomadura sp. 7K507]|uniref:helix-turn-helix transcriptional regulator n=1 Tax=Actinomadura sp. 7K507 TaxID=2530365 RepID=UPI00104F2385|nr:LuxR family transcriptional regulator [Actinomadura sp. 7K507]TDC92018.1 LuxR family transcriptional regulator [Actinomadura sp. 7K507]
MDGRPPTRGTTFGRQRERASIDELLTRVDGPRVMLVEGEPGIGRTRLLEEAARTAADRGFAVVADTAPELRRPAALELLLSVLDEPGPQSPPAGGQDRSAERLQAALEQRARTTSLLVLLDDLQWAEPATILALRTLPIRLASSPVCWILARRTGSGGAELDRLFLQLQAAGAVLVQLRPLPGEAVSDLVTAALGARPDPDLLVLAGGAGGNPLLLLELMNGLSDEGGVVISHGHAHLVTSRMPERVRIVIQERLHELDPAARRLLEVAAMLGPAFHPLVAADLLGVTPADLLPSLEAMLATGLLTTHEDALAFRHDVVRESVITDIPDPVRQALHVQIGRTLLEHGGRVKAAAAHLMAGAVPGVPEVLPSLDRASAEMLDTHPAVAAELIRRALDLTELADPQWFARTMTAMRTLVAAGDLVEAAELAEAALDHCASGPSTAELLTALSLVLVPMGEAARASDTARAVLDMPDLPDEVRDRADLALLQADTGLPESAGVLDRAKAFVKAGDAPGQGLLAGALVVLALNGWDKGELDDALGLARMGVRQASNDGVRDCRLHPGLVLAALLVDVRLMDEARRTMVLGTGGAVGIGRDGWAAGPAIVRSRIDLAEGHPEEAIREARAALEAADAVGARLLSASARSALSVAALRSGDLETAIEHARGEEDAGGPAPPPFDLTRSELIRAQVTEACDGPQAAMTGLRRLLDDLAEHSRALICDPTAAAWLVRTAVAAGETGPAEKVVAAADRLAGMNPGLPSLAAAAEHARGLLHGEPGLLRNAAADHADRWACASAYEDLGILLGGPDGARGRTIQWFDEALSCYVAAGAERDAARIRGRLRRMGERRRHWNRRDRPASGWASLTGAEQRISGLVAQGLTNQKIADQLFISVHTVAFHLRQVFRKLDVRSRVDLARQVLEHSDDVPGARSKELDDGTDAGSPLAPRPPRPE